MPDLSATATTSSARILVVEDESIVATDLERSLRQLGYDVLTTAASCEEAMLVASQQQPDLVLMDIRIRGDRDGIETATLLRQQYQVPVVYMTAYADNHTLERAKWTEPLGYLLKPFRPRDLRSTVEMALYKHEMETRLRERERWITAVVASIGDSVVATDSTGHVTFMNAVAEAALDCSQADAIGRPIDQVMPLFSPEDQVRMEHPLLTAIREQRSVTLVADMLLKLGAAERLVSDNASPILEDGRVLGGVIVFRDVTEERRLQRQVEAANRLVSLGTMAAGIGHEINNPLAAITSNLDFACSALAEDGTAVDLETLAEVLGETSDAARRIREIVRGLSNVARPPDPNPRAEVEKTVDWALHTTQVELRHRARVEVHCAAVPDVAVSDTKLGQVLVNLLLNAAHAIEPGKVEENLIRINVALSDPDEVLVEVTDTGQGIEPALQARIFDPFFTTKTLGHGTGLGLSVCQSIIKSCGGRIEVNSERGRGTTFRLLLPTAGSRRQPSPPAVPPSAKTSTRVLLVDDDPLVTRALERSLSARYHVTSVASVQAAIELLAQDPAFDAILCDLMMPEQTGVDLLQYLERSGSPLARNVILITGGAPTDQMQDFLNGLDGRVLEKPFDAAQLESAIARLHRN